jgi:YbbR domain-containing protein
MRGINMSDKNPRKKDSTTDFFLNFVKNEKEEQAKIEKKKENSQERKVKTLNDVLTGFNYINKALDKLLSNRISIMIISLVLTIILFITFSGGDVLTSATSGVTIKNVAVSVEGLKDGYEVSGIPTSVTVGLIGPSLDIYTTQLTKNYEVYVDLSEYNTGSHNVTLKYRNFSSDLTVMILPDTCNIRISPKITKNFSLSYKFKNERSLANKYSVSVNSLSKQTVAVTASRFTINSIDKVCAVIDVANKTKAFTQTCAVKAYDSDGDEVNCTISPTKVIASCSVNTYSKVVAVKPNFKGSVKDGYQISNYKLSPSTVTIYGKRSDIADISALSCDVNVSGLSGSTTLTGLALKGSDKITKMSVTAIRIDMTIEKKSS